MTDAKPESYLIVCFRYIGDVMVTTSLALSIKTARPDAVVDYLLFEGTEKAVLKNPHVRNIIKIPKGGIAFTKLLSLYKRYDIAIAAYPSDRTVIAAALAGKVSLGITNGRRMEWWKHLLLHFHTVTNNLTHVVSNMQMLAHLMAIKPIPCLTMGYDQDDLKYALSSISCKKYILIHPYSMKLFKYWSAAKWGELARIIHTETDCKVVFTSIPGTEEGNYLKEILSFSPNDAAIFPSGSLNQFAAALVGCSAYIGIDTATTHIAAACKVPTIAIYGPSLTRYWAPWPNGCKEHSPFAENSGVQRYDYVTVIQKDWPCVPCNSETCAITTRGKVECMEQITAEEVFCQLSRLLEYDDSARQSKLHY